MFPFRSLHGSAGPAFSTRRGGTITQKGGTTPCGSGHSLGSSPASQVP
ncbi:hypothetical protein SSAG_04389 [Streptomyces sp. Mg1]|nr:hypothetical protein SSAG_04389 [Streptomyces sp. Mg1]